MPKHTTGRPRNIMAGPSYSNVQIAGIVALYFAVSISLVFVNKLLLSAGTSIPAPLFVTWSQCVVTVGICWLLGQLSQSAYVVSLVLPVELLEVL